MTDRIFDMEGVDGATLVQANATTVGSGTAIHSAAAAVVGATGAHFAANAGLARSIRCTPVASSLTMAASGYLKTPAATPASNMTIATLRTSTTTLRLLYTTAGALQFQPNTGGNLTIATGVPLATTYRIEMLVVIATATTGSVTVKAYSSAAGWTTLLGSATSTTADLGTTAVDQSDWGAITALTPGGIVDVDYVRMGDGRTTEFGPPPAATAPTAHAGTSQDVVAGSTITLDGSTSTAGSGSITNYLWTCTEFPAGASSPLITTPTGATTTVVLAAGGHYAFNLLVTQTGGLKDNATVVEYVYEASNIDVDVYSTNATTYTNEGGAASIKDALNDASSATYALSPPNPTGQTLSGSASPVGPGACSVFTTSNWTGGALTATMVVKNSSGTVTLVTDSWALTSVEVEHETVITGASSLTQAEKRGLQFIYSAA